MVHTDGNVGVVGVEVGMWGRDSGGGAGTRGGGAGGTIGREQAMDPSAGRWAWCSRTTKRNFLKEEGRNILTPHPHPTPASFPTSPPYLLHGSLPASRLTRGSEEPAAPSAGQADGSCNWQPSGRGLNASEGRG